MSAIAGISIGEICDVLNGFAFQSEKYVDKGIRIIRIANVQKGRIDDSSPKYYPDSSMAEISSFMLSDGDLLMSLTGNVGRVAIINADMLPAALNQRVACLRLYDSAPVTKKYFYYYLNSNRFEEDCIRSSKGVAQKNMSTEWLKQYKIPLIPMIDQDRLTSKLDSVSEVLRLRKTQLTELDNLVKSQFIKMFGDPVANPKGWKMSTVAAAAANEKNALKAGPFGSSIKKEMYTKSGYKIYGQEQVISGNPFFGDYYIPEEKYHQLESCAVQAGDVLISLVGTYGKLLVIPPNYEPGIINPRLIKITFDKNKVNTTYFQYYFASDSVMKTLDSNTHGCTMGVLNLGIIKELFIPIPPIDYQERFEVFVRQADKSKFAIQQALDETQRLFDSLMSEYFEA